MIRKYYGRAIVALLLIPVAAISGVAVFELIDPELARGHDHYVRNYALLDHLRKGVLLAALALMAALWLLACAWLLRAKSQPWAWLWLALLGPLGLAVLMAFSDRSAPAPAPVDAYRRRLGRLPQLQRLLYEVLRFIVIGYVALQLAQWLDDGTALFEASRRGVALAVVLAERDASSGMWAFGDMTRAACFFVLIYALWPAGRNAVAWMLRRLRGNRTP